MPDKSREPLNIWAVSDGRAGIENQVRGLAEAIGRLTPARITIKRIRYRKPFDALPNWLCFDAMLDAASDSLAPPYPDIWIAAGRATLRHSRRMRRLSGGKTLVVQLQDPNGGLDAFDMVIAPAHDGLSGGNVLALTGSTNRITPEGLKAGVSEAMHAAIAARPGPYAAVLIGGKSRAYDLSPARARDMAENIRRAAEASGGTLLLTFSRRTPDDARTIISEVLGDVPAMIYDGRGENPYFTFLDAADHILVTEDSVNMATEAAATGKPVYVLAMDARRLAGKFTRFHEALAARGVSRPFEGRLESWSYEPLRETERAAKAVLERAKR